MKTFQQKTSMRGKSEISTISILSIEAFAKKKKKEKKSSSEGKAINLSIWSLNDSLKSPLFDTRQKFQLLKSLEF